LIEKYPRKCLLNKVVFGWLLSTLAVSLIAATTSSFLPMRLAEAAVDTYTAIGSSAQLHYQTEEDGIHTDVYLLVFNLKGQSVQSRLSGQIVQYPVGDINNPITNIFYEAAGIPTGAFKANGLKAATLSSVEAQTHNWITGADSTLTISASWSGVGKIDTNAVHDEFGYDNVEFRMTAVGSSRDALATVNLTGDALEGAVGSFENLSTDEAQLKSSKEATVYVTK
jgi:hypothetical protein